MQFPMSFPIIKEIATDLKKNAFYFLSIIYILTLEISICTSMMFVIGISFNFLEDVFEPLKYLNREKFPFFGGSENW